MHIQKDNGVFLLNKLNRYELYFQFWGMVKILLDFVGSQKVLTFVFPEPLGKCDPYVIKFANKSIP